MPRDRRPLILIPVAALIAIAPLILHGCSCGHDFDFHIINWFEAARQLAHGTFPRWADTPAWNAGEPRFVFYPPLSWLLGAALGLLMPWTWTPMAFTWLALTLAGLSLHHAVRSYVSPNASLIAAAVYLANPYILYTAYERTAYAELLAAIWLPLALHAALEKRVSIPALAVPIALLWLSNAPAAVMGCYGIAFIVLIRIVLPGEASPLRLALNSAIATLLGLGLSGFYLLPAAWERRLVQINLAILPGLRPWDNFLFQHTADPEHDAVLRIASIVAVTLFALNALVLLCLFLARSKATEPTSSTDLRLTGRLRTILLLLPVVIFAMLTPISAPLWRHLPELQFLQFPWRLLAVLGVTFGFSLALTLSRVRLPGTLVALVAATVLSLTGYHAFHQYCYPEDTVAERLAIFQSPNPGTDPTDEYTPRTADNDFLNQQNAGYWLAENPSLPAPASPHPEPAPRDLNLAPATPTNLILNLRNYPAWEITRNGSLITTRLPRRDGLITIPLPAGPSHIEVTYSTLPDQKLGYLLSALSGITLAGLILKKRRQHRRV
ncbi:hypothetical protein JAO29_12095 [Edaphobacter sp. HDX4]|uniref:6-pyruvoyl-tetrahydropterin synthase-related protein n=1 Tax=Edaphobacter sp. HDX4 TaxID=2794064 RepID=UPI002FE60FD2